jgi:tetratricopeptide (TPR) repeat protein
MNPHSQLGEALYQLGRQLWARQRLAEARESIALSVELQPKRAAGHRDLGTLLHLEGRDADALVAYGRAVELDPQAAEAWYNYGVILMRRQQLAEASAAFQQAARLRPGYAQAHNNLGILRQAAGDPAAAEAHYRQAWEADASFDDAGFNWALLCQEQDRPREAAPLLEQLLRRQPQHTDARNNLANIRLELGQPERAVPQYRRVLEDDPEHREANWNLGLSLLQLGQWREGWKQYEWRLRQWNRAPVDRPAPRWAGEPLEGRTLLLVAEQGLGDTLQFVRFAALIAAQGGSVWIECHPQLTSLLQTAPGVAAAFPFGAAPPQYDFYLPLMSAPFVLDVELATLPAASVYLTPDAALVAEWRQRMGPGPQAGIAWSGNPALKTNAKRSLPEEAVQEIARRCPMPMCSLQKDQQMPGVPGWENAAHTFDDAAAIVANLDLVITVDTSIAHLAGALGKTVWTLLPHAADWRWMTRRTDSPWYPSMRLFRQKTRGDWKSVVKEVTNALRHWPRPR